MKLFIIIYKSVKNKYTIKNYFNSTEFNIDYFEYSENLTEYVSLVKLVRSEVNSKAIIFTTTGIGEFLISNKIKNIRAALVIDEYTAESTAAHNNAQIAILPLFVLGNEYAIELSKIFINSKFEGGRHCIRINMLEKLC